MCFNVEITNFERRRHDSYENVKRLKLAKTSISQSEIDVNIKANVFRFDINEKKSFRVENENDNVDDVDENVCEKFFNIDVNN